ncbi:MULTISPECIES: DoxX family protein [Rhodococcus]|uniref:DoxX family protein n=3 Tax=Rhodococcus TaxID=1827 RepID=V9XCE6_9NOCA|nr:MULTISPECIES: DoxX family protein [Rhodococcus]AHD20053.1 DoxX family protein [Rhodococcus pyridinivorans SB3094]MCD2117508.1 DoxX family membrane protein [Rhodococcus pyridinivorans]MCD5420056.1 DoxX family membrane protein [Rhodococcus pyridinivorans]MCT7292225.1 DoxX family membrane protein [Rhodococcus sp. PAE-6]MCZ4625734.1 DoxX family membrane protein [Rhodococcus pyridinivorans]
MLVRRIARPMLASIFIAGGIDALRKPEPKAGAAQPGLDQAVNALPASITDRLPSNPETLVQINAAVQIGAGTLFALGKAPRLSALALIGSLVPTTVAGHDFWNVEDPEARAQQRTQLIKNVSLIGGLLIAAVDTEGKPSLGWRSRRAARAAQKSVAAALPGHSSDGHTAETLHTVAERVKTLTEEAGEQGGHILEIAKERAPELAEAARERSSGLLEVARDRGPVLTERARDRSAEILGVARERAPELAEGARERGTELLGLARERTPELADVARKRGSKLWDTTVDRSSEWAKLAEEQSAILNARAHVAAEKARLRAEAARKQGTKAEKKLAKNLKALEKSIEKKK